MKFRELLNEEEKEPIIKKLVPVREKFKEDVLGIKTEAKLPPGFSSSNIETTDEFIKGEKDIKEVEIKEETNDEEEDEESELEELEEGAEDAETSDVDLEKLKKDVYTKKISGKDPEKGQEIASKQGKMLHASNIIDENGNMLDTEKLIVKMSIRPTELIGQNAKLAKSGSTQIFYDLTLPAYQGLYVDEKEHKIKVVKTCPSAGECKKFCYASKGGFIMFPTSSMAASKIVTFFMNDWDGFKTQLVSELKQAVTSEKKSGKQVVLRWHDAGDFISENYMLMAFEIAKATPEVEHYAYTKQVPMVKKLEAHKPDNFLFRFSFGGLHDADINVKKERHAKVVPLKVFKSIPHTIEGEGNKAKMIFQPKEIETLKQAVAKEFDLELDTIKTYDEVIKMPVGKEPKWNVLVWKGDGDEEAVRKDVIGVYLFAH